MKLTQDELEFLSAWAREEWEPACYQLPAHRLQLAQALRDTTSSIVNGRAVSRADETSEKSLTLSVSEGNARTESSPCFSGMRLSHFVRQSSEGLGGTSLLMGIGLDNPSDPDCKSSCGRS
jgi:hypothetical protein